MTGIALLFWCTGGTNRALAPTTEIALSTHVGLAQPTAKSTQNAIGGKTAVALRALATQKEGAGAHVGANPIVMLPATFTLAAAVVYLKPVLSGVVVMVWHGWLCVSGLESEYKTGV